MANGIVLNIDTTKSEFQNPMVQLRQGDGNYQSLDVTVTSNGSPFNLTGWTVTFMGTTAGGFKIVDASVSNVDTANGKFTYTPTKAWGQDEGMFKEAYFKFTSGVNGNSVASGASFRVNVLDAVDLTAEEAGDYISVVDVMIDKIKTDMDNKLSDTQKTLSDTQSQATTVQGNVNDLNNNVNDLKAQNNAIKTTDNTWTGTNTFNKKIIAPAGVKGNADTADVLNIRPATFTDISVVTSDMITYAGNWSVLTQNVKGVPNIGFAVMEVLPFQGNKTAGIIKMSSTNIVSSNYIGTVGSGSQLSWVLLPDDSKVIHKAGTETVAGDKTFTGSETFSQPISGNFKSIVLPDGTDLYSLYKSNVYYSVPTYAKSQTIINKPAGVNSSFGVMAIETGGYIENSYGGTNLVLFDFAKGNMFIASLSSNGSGVVSLNKAWTRIPTDDSLLVHNTGAEIINGDKTFMSGWYGLRITSTAIQKTSNNGVTWTNI